MQVQKYDDDDIVPTLIGDMRVGDMEKRLFAWDNDNEIGTAREFWFNGQRVKRDASIQLKKVPGAEANVGVFGRFKRLFSKPLLRSLSK